MKWNIGICLYILHMYIYSFLFSVHFSPPFGYFGELGGIFCSLPLRLAARCGENRFPVFRPFWCSESSALALGLWLGHFPLWRSAVVAKEAVYLHVSLQFVGHWDEAPPPCLPWALAGVGCLKRWEWRERVSVLAAVLWPASGTPLHNWAFLDPGERTGNHSLKKIKTKKTTRWQNTLSLGSCKLMLQDNIMW